MTEVIDLSGFDLGPSIDDVTEQDENPLMCEVPGCTNAIVKPARGRTPSKCPEHKKQKTAAGTKSPVSGKSWSRAVEIENLLTNYVIGIGTATKFVNKVDGEIIVEGGPKIVHELVDLAKSDTNLQKYLIWFATPGKYAPLIGAVGGVAIPIMANHGMMDHFAAMLGGNSNEGR